MTYQNYIFLCFAKYLLVFFVLMSQYQLYIFLKTFVLTKYIVKDTLLHYFVTVSKPNI